MEASISFLSDSGPTDRMGGSLAGNDEGGPGEDASSYSQRDPDPWRHQQAWKPGWRITRQLRRQLASTDVSRGWVRGSLYGTSL